MLYHKYRPSSFEQIKGNEDIISSLQTMLSKPDPPHVYLLHGQYGCGKTSIARIIAAQLDCNGSDLKEVDSGQFRGIDTIREIRTNSSYQPLEGKNRCWIIDECFVKGTLISTPFNGDVPIEWLKKGNFIYSLNGIDLIKEIFINKIDLNRIIKIDLEHNKFIFCSEDHLFMTNCGWIKAKDLKNNFVYLKTLSNFVHYKESLNTYKNDTYVFLLQKLQETIGWKKSKEILLQKMCKYIKCKTCKNRYSKMCNLWKRIFNKMVLSRCNLWKNLWKYFSRKPSNWFKKIKRNNTKIINIPQNICSNKKRARNKKTKLNTNDIEQSITRLYKYIKSKSNKKNKWNFTYLERGTWWKWKINRTSKNTFFSIRLGNRTTNSNWKQTKRWFRVSYMLQIRYWKSRTKNSNRNRWQGTQYEKKQIKRFEKRNEITKIRVENITFYQRGNNDESFKSIIGNTERNQGFIELYDLEILHHPSYFANNILVHNCHKLTGDAQSALLKILEDTPTNVYFIICTTEPQKLLSTIRSRCIDLQVKTLNDEQLTSLLRKVVRGEGETLQKEVYEQIVQDSLGHPRNALNILEQVLSSPVENRLNVAKKSAENQSQSIELCRVLIRGAKWKEVSFILNGLKDQEPESIRRLILGYCSSILLKEDNMRAGLIMENMTEPFYNSGWPGLVLACYLIVKGE